MFKKILLTFIAMIATVCLTCGAAFACFTIIVGKDASSTKKVIVGHNEDEGNRGIYRHSLVPTASWPEGAKIPAEVSPLPAMNGDIPQVKNTLGYYWSEGREARFGTHIGMYADDAFFNENGVYITSNNNGDAKVPKGGFGKQGIVYVLRRAIAERAKNSRHGVMIAAALLRDYGYAGSRTYTIADANEAWMLQVTQGTQYIARKVGDNEVVLMPNMFTIRNVDFSGAREVEPDIMANDSFIWSKNLVKHAIDNGFYKPADPSDFSYRDFDFARCYQQNDNANSIPMVVNYFRMKHGLSIILGREFNAEKSGFPFSVTPVKIDGNPIYNGTVSPELIKRVLRTHFEGTLDDPIEARISLPGANPHDTLIKRVCDQTTDESVVAEFGEHPALTTLWVAFGRPCEQPYIPMHVMGVSSLPDKLNRPDDPAKEMAEHFTAKPELASWDGGSAWQNIRAMQNMLDMLYSDVIDGHRIWLLAKDAELKEINEKTVALAKKISESGKRKEFLTKRDNEVFNSVFGSIMEIKKSMKPIEMTAEPRSVDKSKAQTIYITFRLGEAHPNPATIRAGLGMTSTRNWGSPISVSEKPDKKGFWVAAFDSKTLVGENPFATAGDMDYWIGGRDTTGKAFGGFAVIEVTKQ